MTIAAFAILAAASAAGVLIAVLALRPEVVAAAGSAGQSWLVAGVPLGRRAGAGQRRTRTLADRLSQADIKLKPSEFMLLQLGIAAVLGVAALLRFGFALQPPIFALVGYLAPLLYLQLRRDRRQRAISRQLPDVLALLSSSLKAGLSFPQAIDNLSRYVGPPASEEFTRVVREMQIGRSPEQALLNLVRRVDSEDLDLVVTAVIINSQVGGNLAKILDGIQDTIRERVRVAGQIAALTAQARASGVIITALPFFLALVLYFIAPAYFQPLLQNPIGIVLCGLCVISIGIGNLLIRRIGRIDL
jgi:tight adherence protein B